MTTITVKLITIWRKKTTKSDRQVNAFDLKPRIVLDKFGLKNYQDSSDFQK